MNARVIPRPSLDEAVYRSRFVRWHERASVRAKPERQLGEGAGAGLVYFPPELVPMASHEQVTRCGSEASARVLMQRLHVYLDFTAELEQQVVNPVCASIGRGRSGLHLPDAMLADAFKIYTDEAWHAQFSDDLQRQVVLATGIPAVRPDMPAFMRCLADIHGELPSDARSLCSLFVAIVSETLISAILADIPRDARVVCAVRDVISDHAIDEGTHHAFFASLLEHAWPQLGARERRIVSLRLPAYIRSFLEPDMIAQSAVLLDVGLTTDEAGQVLADSYTDDRIDRSVRDDARATLRHLARVGVLDDPETLEAFQAARLLGDNGVAGLSSRESLPAVPQPAIEGANP